MHGSATWLNINTFIFGRFGFWMFVFLCGKINMLRYNFTAKLYLSKNLQLFQQDGNQGFCGMWFKRVISEFKKLGGDCSWSRRMNKVETQGSYILLRGTVKNFVLIVNDG